MGKICDQIRGVSDALILVDAVWDDNHEQIVRLDFKGQKVESEEKETVESAVGSTDDEKEEDEGASD